MNVLMTCGCQLDARTHRDLWRVLTLATAAAVPGAREVLAQLPDPPPERDWSLPLRSEVADGEAITP
jgi:hypothetical protein